MRDKYIAQTERVVGKCRIAPRRAFEIAQAVQLNLPKRAACRVNHEQIAFMIEGNSVGDQRLRA